MEEEDNYDSEEPVLTGGRVPLRSSARPSPLTSLLMQQQQQHSRQTTQSFVPLGKKPQTSTPQTIPFNEANTIAELANSIRHEQDKSLLELCSQLETFTPIIPDTLTEFVMTKAGLDPSDLKIKRLLAMLTQKHITDIAQDAMQYCKIRNTGPGSRDRKSKDKRAVLSMEDLSAALQDYGMSTKRPPYYR